MEAPDPVAEFAKQNIVRLESFYNVQEQLDKRSALWLSLMPKDNITTTILYEFDGVAPNLILYLTSKYYRRVQTMDRWTWVSPNNPKIEFIKTENPPGFILHRTNKNPKRDEFTLRNLQRALMERFHGIHTKTSQFQLAIEAKTQRTVIDLTKTKTRKMIKFEDEQNIDLNTLLMFIIIHLFRSDMSNKTNFPINLCIFCDSPATRWMEDDHDIKVCEKEICELKLF